MRIEGYKQIFAKYKPEALEWSKDAACSIPLAQMWSDINAALNILSKYVTSRSIVGWELTEIRNACGEPRSSVKQENELTSAS